MSCDLHIHSTCSDGAVPIERLAPIAARTGLHTIALSDHDTLLSAQYAYAHTGQDGVELIPAVELTGYDFERQHRVHLLCYYPDVDCPALREHCAIMKERRNACALQSAKELEQLYPQFTADLAWETTKASGVLFKSGLMQALELLGLTDGSIYGETYHKLFGWNPRGIVLHSPEYLPVRQVLEQIVAEAVGSLADFVRRGGICPPHGVQKYAPAARTGGRGCGGRHRGVPPQQQPGGQRRVPCSVQAVRPCGDCGHGLPWPQPQAPPSHRHLYRTGRSRSTAARHRRKT